MTIDEAILEIGYYINHHADISVPSDAALIMAIEALRAQQESEKNEPLTRKEILDMDGQPVWIVYIPAPFEEDSGFWALVSAEKENDEIYLLNSLGGSSSYDEALSDVKAVYRRPPEKEGL